MSVCVGLVPIDWFVLLHNSILLDDMEGAPFPAEPLALA